MKRSLFILFVLFIGLNVFGQQRRRSNSGIPQTNREPTEQEIEKRQREIEERKEEYIDNFISTLEADDFQKQIIKQTIDSFFDAKVAILKTRFEHSFDRKQAIENLENTHFIELKELISKDDMSKVQELIKGKFDEKEVVKAKKKKKKRRKKDKG